MLFVYLLNYSRLQLICCFLTKHSDLCWVQIPIEISFIIICNLEGLIIIIDYNISINRYFYYLKFHQIWYLI